MSAFDPLRTFAPARLPQLGSPACRERQHGRKAAVTASANAIYLGVKQNSERHKGGYMMVESSESRVAVLTTASASERLILSAARMFDRGDDLLATYVVASSAHWKLREYLRSKNQDYQLLQFQLSLSTGLPSD
jgi:hypothetical protein